MEVNVVLVKLTIFFIIILGAILLFRSHLLLDNKSDNKTTKLLIKDSKKSNKIEIDYSIKIIELNYLKNFKNCNLLLNLHDGTESLKEIEKNVKRCKIIDKRENTIMLLSNFCVTEETKINRISNDNI